MELLFNPNTIDPTLPKSIRANKHLLNLQHHLHEGLTTDNMEDWEFMLQVALDNYLDVLAE